jgi:hypothetical protein
VRVIVCGSRTWTDRDAIWDRLDKLPRPVVIVHGDSRGADSIADDWALRKIHDERAVGVSVEALPANWRGNGKAAGPIRNSELARRGADLCLAFRMPGKSNGTDDMIKKARAAGIPVEVILP